MYPFTQKSEIMGFIEEKMNRREFSSNRSSCWHSYSFLIKQRNIPTVADLLLYSRGWSENVNKNDTHWMKFVPTFLKRLLSLLRNFPLYCGLFLSLSFWDVMTSMDLMALLYINIGCFYSREWNLIWLLNRNLISCKAFKFSVYSSPKKLILNHILL